MDNAALLDLFDEEGIEYDPDYRIGYYNENASRYFTPDLYLPELNTAVLFLFHNRTTRTKDMVDLFNKVNSCTIAGIKVFLYEYHSMIKNPRRVITEIQKKSFFNELCSM